MSSQPEDQASDYSLGENLPRRPSTLWYGQAPFQSRSGSCEENQVDTYRPEHLLGNDSPTSTGECGASVDSGEKATDLHGPCPQSPLMSGEPAFELPLPDFTTLGESADDDKPSTSHWPVGALPEGFGVSDDYLKPNYERSHPFLPSQETSDFQGDPTPSVTEDWDDVENVSTPRAEIGLASSCEQVSHMSTQDTPMAGEPPFHLPVDGHDVNPHTGSESAQYDHPACWPPASSPFSESMPSYGMGLRTRLDSQVSRHGSGTATLGHSELKKPFYCGPEGSTFQHNASRIWSSANRSDVLSSVPVLKAEPPKSKDRHARHSSTEVSRSLDERDGASNEEMTKLEARRAQIKAASARYRKRNKHTINFARNEKRRLDKSTRDSASAKPQFGNHEDC